ncbi:Uma2 family endonuclease [Streptomyces boncukensis]|uniref:Uma2 family endonuclease n=1 Tax=Streptomyces boncukensis TaxID=2711219 RepID=A0A6G4X798_9ACTN|nr:Uma2 family endonuclease [Streptomyces boncukensis]NGO73012.1 Uma2 family endonuclease [Streptomyces boncukensis]
MGAVMAAEAPARATDEHWAFPPGEGWTFDQAQELDLPFDWELVDGMIVVRGQAKVWHSRVQRKLANALEDAQVEPYEVDLETCVVLDRYNARKPDMIVYDGTGMDLNDAPHVPVAAVVLAIEVVSPGSRVQDRDFKPVQYATAEIPYYWRVEQERDNQIAVHEYWLNTETRTYFPRPERPVHRRELITEHPFPVKIDLAALTSF